MPPGGHVRFWRLRVNWAGKENHLEAVGVVFLIPPKWQFLKANGWYSSLPAKARFGIFPFSGFRFQVRVIQMQQVNKFASHDTHLTGSLESEPYSVAFHFDHRDGDVAADDHFLALLPRENQHGNPP
jgi:hypothetical protein